MSTDATALHERAIRVLPGGVTAGARANAALGHPFYVSRADGPFVYDQDGRRLIDLCMSNGATLLGHGHPAVADAVRRALELGIACAYDGEPQVRLAERLVAQIPSFDMVRFTGSGTEACQYVVRIARAATGRRRILKFEGNFHGFNEALSFNFWPTQGYTGESESPAIRPETSGLPFEASQEILVLPFNDVRAFMRAIEQHGEEIAAVIMEPIYYDLGAILPDREFLDQVRAVTAQRGIVLIFDEILSAYRTGPDCAQGYLGVTPDLSVIGKAIGGGVPLSAFGGRRDLMECVSPVGSAVHTGTYNAHLIPILAAHAFLDTIAEAGFYEALLRRHDRLVHGLRAAFAEAGLPVRVQGVGARFGMFFAVDPHEEVRSFRQAARHDTRLLNLFCREMDERGVYCAPAWHHGLCAAHNDELVDQVLEAAAQSAREVAARIA